MDPSDFTTKRCERKPSSQVWNRRSLTLKSHKMENGYSRPRERTSSWSQRRCQTRTSLDLTFEWASRSQNHFGFVYVRLIWPRLEYLKLILQRQNSTLVTA